MRVSNLYPVLVSTAEVRLYKQNNLLQIGYEINIPGHIKINRRKPIFHDFFAKRLNTSTGDCPFLFASL